MDENGDISIDKEPGEFGNILCYLKSGYYKDLDKIDIRILNAEIDFYALNIPKLKKVTIVYCVNGSWVDIKSNLVDVLYFTPDLFVKQNRELAITNSLFECKLLIDGWTKYKSVDRYNICYKICEDKNYTKEDLEEFVKNLINN